MVHPSAAIILGSVVLAHSVHGQVLAGSNEAGTTATAVATEVVATVVTTSLGSIEDGIASVLSTQAILGTGTTAVASQSAGQDTASVTSIYFPGADQLPYVASLIGEGNGAQTLAISCGPGVDADTCGFPSSVTVTAGPSTAYVSVANEEATFIYDCKITASTAAVCQETFNGDNAYIATESVKGATGSTSAVITETLDASDIYWMPITITAGGKTSAGVLPPTANSQPAGGKTSAGVLPLTANSQPAGSGTPAPAPPAPAPPAPPAASSAAASAPQPAPGSDGNSVWSALGGVGNSLSAPSAAQSASDSVGGSPSAISAGGTPPAVAPSEAAGGNSISPAGTTAIGSSSAGGVPTTATAPKPATWTGAAAKSSVLGHLAAGALMFAGLAL